MKKAYFQYYESFENIVGKIKNDAERSHFREVIIRYGLYGEEPENLSELEDMAWGVIKELIEQQKNRREINTQNRRKPEDTEPVIETEKPVAKETTVTETEKTERFQKPTLEEVKAYCKEKSYSINADAFYSYYESNGWKVGRSSMKNWKAAVMSWNARDRSTQKSDTVWQKESAGAADYAEYF